MRGRAPGPSEEAKEVSGSSSTGLCFSFSRSVRRPFVELRAPFDRGDVCQPDWELTLEFERRIRRFPLFMRTRSVKDRTDCDKGTVGILWLGFAVSWYRCVCEQS